jgi:helix-turn-helix protein
MVLVLAERTVVTRRGRARSAPFRPGVAMAEVRYDKPSPAAQVRELIARAGLSQRGAAKELEISERMMRYYCAGEQHVPRMVILALERLVDLQRQVR